MANFSLTMIRPNQAPQKDRQVCKGVCRNSANYCSFQNHGVLGLCFVKFKCSVMLLQDWVRWGVFAVIVGESTDSKGDNEKRQTHPELQD